MNPEPWQARVLSGLLRMPLPKVWTFALKTRHVRLAHRASPKPDGQDSLEFLIERVGALARVEAERREWLSNKLTREAQRLRLPVPGIGVDRGSNELLPPWKSSGSGPEPRPIYLTDEGYKELRDAIRAERAARRAARANLITWLAAWTGLLSAVAAIITAYVAVLALRVRP